MMPVTGCAVCGAFAGHADACPVRLEELAATTDIQIVFDGPPGPEPGRFVEVEDMNGHGLRVGRWVERPDGYWALILTVTPTPPMTKRERRDL